MLKKKDELFGTIIFEDLWKGETSITMFGRAEKATLYINGEENNEITSNQRETFLNFQSNMDRIMSEAEASIFEYYQSIYEDYRAMSNSDEADIVAPKISSERELSRLVKPTSLLIRYDFEDGIRRVGVLCDCTWEPEHGLGISIENEKVIEIGFQDIVL